MEVERPPRSIEQWYKHANNLDRYQRESRREEERLREREKDRGQGQRQIGMTNNQEDFQL